MIWKSIQLGLADAAGASSAGQAVVAIASDALPCARNWQTTTRISVESYEFDHGGLMR